MTPKGEAAAVAKVLVGDDKAPLWRLLGELLGRIRRATRAAAGGGVWKTTDGGNSWDPLFDKQGISSIGSIAISDSDPNVLFAGSGEACIRGNISFGDGV